MGLQAGEIRRLNTLLITFRLHRAPAVCINGFTGDCDVRQDESIGAHAAIGEQRVLELQRSHPLWLSAHSTCLQSC